MLLPFFYLLRSRKVPVTVTEWMTLMEALSKGLAYSDLAVFYSLSRSLLVKDVAYYDAFDDCFAHFFKDADLPPMLHDELEKWLSDPNPLPNLSPEEQAALDRWDLDKLREEFEKRLQEQTEAHHGGNRWIGTGGTSPFGHGGVNPQGVRVHGESRNKSAIQVAHERRFRNFRNDLVLDVRQMKAALKKLRALERVGAADELDLDETIDKTCRDAGEIELVFHPERKNRLKLLLLMDAGGSMDPYARLVSRLFSAASQMNHFKEFKHFYFHNCVYEFLYEDIWMDSRVATGDLFRQLDASWRLIFVGDAAMAPSELMNPYGSLYYYHRNQQAGVTWLDRFRDHFRRAIWLNPINNRRYWNYTYTTKVIGNIFPMFPLTLGGLEEGIQELRK